MKLWVYCVRSAAMVFLFLESGSVLANDVTRYVPQRFRKSLALSSAVRAFKPLSASNERRLLETSAMETCKVLGFDESTEFETEEQRIEDEGLSRVLVDTSEKGASKVVEVKKVVLPLRRPWEFVNDATFQRVFLKNPARLALLNRFLSFAVFNVASKVYDPSSAWDDFVKTWESSNYFERTLTVVRSTFPAKIIYEYLNQIYWQPKKGRQVVELATQDLIESGVVWQRHIKPNCSCGACKYLVVSEPVHESSKPHLIFSRLQCKGTTEKLSEYAWYLTLHPEVAPSEQSMVANESESEEKIGELNRLGHDSAIGVAEEPEAKTEQLASTDEQGDVKTEIGMSFSSPSATGIGSSLPDPEDKREEAEAGTSEPIREVKRWRGGSRIARAAARAKAKNKMKRVLDSGLLEDKTVHFVLRPQAREFYRGLLEGNIKQLDRAALVSAFRGLGVEVRDDKNSKVLVYGTGTNVLNLHYSAFEGKRRDLVAKVKGFISKDQEIRRRLTFVENGLADLFD